ncbi:MAG: PQQ-dependent sugar dehydrogenase [Polyangiales bacterium]
MNRFAARAAMFFCALALPLNVVDAQPVFAPNFQHQAVFSGLRLPTTVRFAPDGRIFVAEQKGAIKVFDSITDSNGPDVINTLVPNVFGFRDRGLLGMALDPDFANNGYLYVIYAYNAPPGQTAPYWQPRFCAIGEDPVNNRCCAADSKRCTITGRVSRLQINASNQVVGSEQVLIGGNNFCQEFQSHSVGALDFAPDGSLYASMGDGASYDTVDTGNYGDVAGGFSCNSVQIGGQNPDPPNEGGALRSQDILTSGDPLGYNGAVLRIDPATGNALSDNPLYGGNTADDRIVAFGLRNPFTMRFRPGTSELWIGDVGWTEWEEVNRIVDPLSTVLNFGWPCYEGAGPHSGGYQPLTFCQNLYNAVTGAPGTIAPPFYTYGHGAAPGSANCREGTSSSIAGVGFYQSGEYPNEFDGSLIFTDYSRSCVWAMQPGNDGVPDPSKIVTLISHAATPVDTVTGPNGDIFYLSIATDFSNIDNSGVLYRLHILDERATCCEHSGDADKRRGTAHRVVRRERFHRSRKTVRSFTNGILMATTTFQTRPGPRSIHVHRLWSVSGTRSCHRQRRRHRHRKRDDRRRRLRAHGRATAPLEGLTYDVGDRSRFRQPAPTCKTVSSAHPRFRGRFRSFIAPKASTV